MPSIDIFIKSFRPDFQLLQFALKSIARNVTGYNNIILLIPEKDKQDFDTRGLPERTLIHYVEDKIPGWLYQQVCKMQAYKYCHADYIMFSDSDCLFTRPVNVQDCLIDGKPEILHTRWELTGDAQVWKKPTEAFMKELAPYEFMRRNNMVLRRDTLVNISNYAPDLEATIMGSERWSEFNAMGCYAFKYEKEKYRFVNTDDWAYVPPLAEQVWSHASKKEGVSATHLREYIRTLETIMKSVGINPPE